MNINKCIFFKKKHNEQCDNEHMYNLTSLNQHGYQIFKYKKACFIRN